MTACVVLTLLKYDFFNFLCTFHQPLLHFKEFTKFNFYQIELMWYRWKVTAEWSITLFFFSRKKEIQMKKMTKSFHNFLSQRATI